MHKTVVCSCGRQLSTCRCPGPKVTEVSKKPCTHSLTPDEVKAKYASILNLPVWIFEEVIDKYNKEILDAFMRENGGADAEQG